MKVCFLSALQQYADDSSFLLQKCVKDTLSPICIKLKFSQVDSENASAILNVDSVTQVDVEVCTVITTEGCRQSHEFALL